VLQMETKQNQSQSSASASTSTSTSTLTRTRTQSSIEINIVDRDKYTGENICKNTHYLLINISPEELESCVNFLRVNLKGNFKLKVHDNNNELIFMYPELVVETTGMAGMTGMTGMVEMAGIPEPTRPYGLMRTYPTTVYSCNFDPSDTEYEIHYPRHFNEVSGLAYHICDVLCGLDSELYVNFFEPEPEYLLK
jgi:hypothetical protein